MATLKLITHIVVMRHCWEARTNEVKTIQKCSTSILSAQVEQAGSALPSLYIPSHLTSTSTHSLHPPFGLWVLSWCGRFVHYVSKSWLPSSISSQRSGYYTAACNWTHLTHFYYNIHSFTPCWVILMLVNANGDKLYQLKTKTLWAVYSIV